MIVHLRIKELTELDCKHKTHFVEWSVCGFKVGLNELPAPAIENDDIYTFKRSAFLVGNNTGISRFFKERVCQKYIYKPNESLLSKMT